MRAEILGPRLAVAVRRLHAGQLGVVAHLAGAAASWQGIGDLEQRRDGLLKRRADGGQLLRTLQVSAVLGPQFALANREERRGPDRARGRGVLGGRGVAQRVVFPVRREQTVEAPGPHERVGVSHPNGWWRDGSGRGGLRLRAGRQGDNECDVTAEDAKDAEDQP